MALAVAVAIVLAWPGTVPAARPADNIWYVPNPGTLDLRRMFEHPEEWAASRRLIDVFQFTQQHMDEVPDPVVGPNGFQALARDNVFAKLSLWGIKTSIGVGSVKEFYCTADGSGMAEAVNNTLRAVKAVRSARGLVHFLAMDEPFFAGQSDRCGGPALEPTADRLQTYITSVQRQYPDVRIGLIEAYPSFNADAFGRMLTLMRERRILPAFVHVDVDLRAVRPSRNDLVLDMRRIQQLCAADNVPFGIILWGYNGDADALFAVDATRLALAFRPAFTEGHSLPDHLIFESWSESTSGLRITPSNLPEHRSYTLTNLMWQLQRLLLAPYEPTGASAVPR